MTPWVSIREWWQWLYARICTFLYFDQITLVGDEMPPAGPVLFVGTHRNGILDALVYSNVLGRMTFVLAKRLHRTFLGRLLFGGIGVVRADDAKHHDMSGARNQTTNRGALDECRDYLKAGSRIFVFPEGKSALGPRLLEIKPGAARITVDTLKVRPDLKVVPVAVSYERAWGFRSRVEVKLGRPVTLDDLDIYPQAEQFDIVYQRISDGLHTLAAEFETPDLQEASEAAANVQRLAGLTTHCDAVKQKARSDQHGLAKAWVSLKETADAKHAARYNRLPMVSEGSCLVPLIKLMLLGPFVLFMVLANGPVLLAARFGAKRLANDNNVISLLRLVIGIPVMLAWGLVTFAALAFLEVEVVWFLALSLSLIGLGNYDTVKRALTLVRNRPLRAELLPAWQAFVVAAMAEPDFA